MTHRASLFKHRVRGCASDSPVSLGIFLSDNLKRCKESSKFMARTLKLSLAHCRPQPQDLSIFVSVQRLGVSCKCPFKHDSKATTPNESGKPPTGELEPRPKGKTGHSFLILKGHREQRAPTKKSQRKPRGLYTCTKTLSKAWENK